MQNPVPALFLSGCHGPVKVDMRLRTSARIAKRMAERSPGMRSILCVAGEGVPWLARTMRRALVMVLFVVVVSPATAADYYVKNGGSNGADGLSIATAWATLNYAADQVDPGDTVHVLDGNYQGFDLRRSGTLGNPIAFVADGSNVRITSDNGVTPDGINVENAAHVVIDGFIVDNRTRAGIRAAVAEFITIRNCRAGSNGRWGILTGFVDDLLIENNEMHHSIAEHGIYASNSGDRPVIRNNLVYDNYANGIHINADESQGGDGTISNALVEGNVIHGNGAGGGSGINMDGVVDSVVRNNLLYDNHASGISLYRIDGATGATNNLVVNNTIINAADGRWCVNINNGSSGNRVRNNILYNFHSFRGAIVIDSSSRPGFVSSNNSVMSRFSTDDGNTVIALSAWQALGYDTNSFLAVPADHFIVPGSDFHLLDTSPAIDAGTATDAPVSDLDGNPRPIGAAVDIGAYEATSLTCGDGTPDAGEQCGEPGLPLCADVCTTCQQCTCAPLPLLCGDGNVCGAEECEDSGDCGSGQVCAGCQCVTPPVCNSGITIERPRLRMRASPFFLRFKGQAVIPKPWSGIDPVSNGLRIVIDAITGAGGIDVVVPGGALWTVNGAATRWTYRDPAGSAGGITRIVVLDRSNVQPGLVRWVVKGDGAIASLPDVDAVRSAVVLGDTDECALLAWNGPGDERPRCDGDATTLRCR